jgi:hypothetical protein
MAAEWAEITDIDKVKFQKVLAQYGQTMWYAHGFERTLKTLYVLSNVQIEAKKAPLTDEEFTQFLSDKGMIGPTLKKLLKLFDEIGLKHFPRIAEDGLEQLKQMRNWLAHSYLIDNSRTLPNPEAHKDLINELRFFAEAFKTMTSVWEPLLDIAIEKLGEGTSKEIEEKFGPFINELQREHLRKRIEGYKLRLNMCFGELYQQKLK